MCGDGFVGVDSLVAHGDADIAVPGDDLGDVRRQSVEETGSERFTCCAEWVPRAVVCWGYSSCLVIAGFGEFGGVAGPVASACRIHLTAVVGARPRRSASTAAGSWAAKSIRAARRPA